MTIEDAGTKAEEQQEEPKLLAGKYKTAEELEKGYEEAQKLIGGHGQVTQRIRGQVQQLGYDVDDAGNLIQLADFHPADSSGTEPFGDVPSDTETELALLKEQVRGLTDIVNVTTLNQAQSEKISLLRTLPEGLQERAGQMYEQIVLSMPARSRVDAGTLKAVRRVIVGQLVEEGAFTQTPKKAGGGGVSLGQIVPQLSRPASETTLEGSDTTVRLDKEEEGVVDEMLRQLKDSGVSMTKKEYLEKVAANRARRRR